MIAILSASSSGSVMSRVGPNIIHHVSNSDISHPIIHLPTVAGVNLSVTKHVFMLWLVAIITSLSIIIPNRSFIKSKSNIPSGWLNATEAIVQFIRDAIVKPNVGEKWVNTWTPLMLTFFFFILLLQTTSGAQPPHYVDFKYVLNESKAGKEAQIFLKKKLDSGIKSLQKSEKAIQEEEKKIIQQKKLISPDDYKTKVTKLREKVASLQNQRNKLLDTVAKQRSKARTELLKNLNPIIKDYMNEKKIRMVLDKKSILLADENLDITKEITDLLNKKLKSINLK